MDELESRILERIDSPGWVTTRGVLLDPSGRASEEENRRVEQAMLNLAKEGKLTVWRLLLQNEPTELMAVARVGFALDKELEQRGAWAKAVRYETE
jgi:hypothetical protein